MLNKDFAKTQLIFTKPIQWSCLVFRSLKENGVLITLKKIKLRVANRFFPPPPPPIPPPPVERHVRSFPLPPLVNRSILLIDDFKLPQGYVAVTAADRRAFRVYKRDEKRIFKYIPPQYAETYREVMARLADHNLLGTMFVNTWISNAIDDTHPDSLFLECEVLEPMTSVHEWPPNMIWDFTQFMLDFIIDLDKAGLQILDPHANNATFHAGKFVFYDHGSIAFGKMSYMQILVTINNLINALVLMSHGQVARTYMYLKPSPPGTSGFIKVGYNDVKGYMSHEECSKYEEMIYSVEDLFEGGDVQAACNILKEYARDLQQPVLDTPWSKYAASANKDGIHKKYTITADWIRSIKAKSFIDMAGNEGVLSKLFQGEVKYSICADVDLNCLNTVYTYVATSYSSPQIYPVYMDISLSHLFQNPRFIQNSLTVCWMEDKRLQCECAVALSFLHHVVFDRAAIGFDSVLECFLAHTSKYLIVEWIDRTDFSVLNHWDADRVKSFPWYNQENFEKSLSVYCDILDSKPSGDTRTLYLCAIKS